MSTKTLLKVRKATQSPRARRIAIALVVLVAVYGLVGFFAAPPLIRQIAERQLGEALGRPAHIERVAFNPYALRLEADHIRVDEKGDAGVFFSAERLVVRLSWFSLLRFAPIVDEVKLDSPQANIVRYEAQRFNFTDIVEKFSKPSKPSGGPALFSVSNIDVENGRIDFDDRLIGIKHVVDQLSLGVPFIATLPSQSNIFVDPRFSARVDGSLIRVAGKTKPFASSREAEVALKFIGLDVPQLLSYLPAKLPVTVQTGRLAGDLKLHFVMAGATPTLTVTGTADLTDAQIVDEQRAPLFAARAVHVAAASVEPFRQVFHFDEIRLDQPSLHIARERSGELSVASALSAPFSAAPVSAASASAASAASVASEAAAASQAAAPLDVSIKHFALNDGDIALEDRAPAQPVSLGLTHLTVSLDGFSTLSKAPAHYAVRTALAQGGTLEATGSFGLAAKTADGKLMADALALTLVQPYLDDMTAARIEAGTLGTTLTVKADWSKTPSNVQFGVGEVTLKSLKLTGPAVAAGSIAPAPSIALDEGHVAIKEVDLATRKAEITSIDVTGLSVKGARSKDGRLDLAALAELPQQTREAAAKSQPARSQTRHHRAGVEAPPANVSSVGGAQPAWHYMVEALRLKDGFAQIVDDLPAHPATLRLSAIQLDVRNVSDDMSRPLPVKFAVMLNGRGMLEASGDVAPNPFEASLKLHANRLDVAAFEPYVGTGLNAAIASALLNAWGDVKVGMAGTALRASYKGGAALNDVRLLDRVTSAPLAGWRSLVLARANVHYDGRSADIDVGRITFAQFFGSVLLDAQGKLNLDEVLAREKTATPANTPTHRAGSTTVALVHEAPPQPPQPGQPAIRAHVGEVVLEQGRVNYTDNFVKPNFNAKLVDITGTIGAFGTDARAPAPVDISGSLAGNGPISIRGSVNPLVDKPSLDVSASAHDIELRNLTPYSLKYAGYPITKGKLNVDLHYKLENAILTANNHLFIAQLTFGEHVANDTATKLPVRLAIALLKNSRGEIDVNIPVSGSLSDPQFSLGSLIWGAVAHLFERAVTAPFTLLTNAFGGAGNADVAEQLHYVAFSPGSAALTDATREKLDTLAKLLAEKAEVKLELTGRADPAIDTQGLRVAYVDDLIRKEKAQALAGRGQSVDASTVKVDASEYGDYLKKAYKNADFQKPRNLVGLTRSLPDDDMKRMLANHAPINEASVRALAQQRAEQVRQYLAGKIDAQRISIASPKLDANDVKDNGPTTRVDFGLQ